LLKEQEKSLGTPLIEMRSIVKKFPGVTALNGVSFSLRSGEIHALLGENGSGKSTLIKILSGVYFADEGEIFFDGRPIDCKNPADAQKLGVATIHQEINLIPNMDIASNMYLNWEPLGQRSCLIDFRAMYQKAREVMEKMGIDLNPKTQISRLSAAEKQLVEIAKAMAKEMRVLVLDEPTAALPAHEVEILFSIIGQLKKQGIGIIYVSHRLEEIELLADRVTIIRDGNLIATREQKDLTVDEIIKLMVGREVKKIQRTYAGVSDKIVLQVKDLYYDEMFKGVNLSLKHGEILGIAGLVGSGRSELASALGGALRPTNGRVLLEGKETRISSPSDALKSGIGFVPSERKAEGLSTLLSVKDNIIMASLKSISSFGVLFDRTVSRTVEEYISKLKIKVSGLNQKAGNLSGGNQQKVVLAKVLAKGSNILIFDEPTRGIDVGTRREIYNLMDELAQAGHSIVISSSDLPELLQTCDRIVTMYKGEIVDEFSHDVTQEEVLRAVLGQSEKRTNKSLKSEKNLPSIDENEIYQRKKEKHSSGFGGNLSQAFGVPLFALALIIFFSFKSPGFSSLTNVFNLSRQLAILLLVASAQTFAIITRGIDMSIGAMMALVSMFTGLVGIATGSFVVGIYAGLLVAVIMGCLSGTIIGGLGADSFIVTLGVMYIARGSALMINDGQPIFGFPSWISYISDGKVGPIPFMVILAVLCAGICQIILTRTRFGRHITAVGGNMDGAKVSGVRVGLCIGSGYMVSAVLAGIAGIIMTARFFSSQPNLGSGAHLEAVTVAIIGGISLAGGRGDILGVFTGVLVIGILSNGMNIINVPAYSQLVIMGTVLILSLIIDRMRQIAFEKQK